MNINQYAKKNHFYNMGQNIYFRVHDYICLDVLEIIKRENYYTIELSVYCFYDKQNGFNCMASRNLGTLGNPLFNEYWWNNSVLDVQVIKLLETVGDTFWKHYSSPDSIIKSIDYYMDHSGDQEMKYEDRQLLFYFVLANNNMKQATLLSQELSLSILDHPENIMYEDIQFERKGMYIAWTYFSRDYNTYLNFLKHSMEDVLIWMLKQDGNDLFDDRNENWVNYYYDECEENKDV